MRLPVRLAPTGNGTKLHEKGGERSRTGFDSLQPNRLVETGQRRPNAYAFAIGRKEIIWK
ncbi:MAG: hypothetical protein ACLU40_03865 [Acutalibacteraceae bacterium]